MSAAVRDAIGRAAVPASAEDRYTECVGGLERCVHGVHGLGGPAAFRLSPADRHGRDVVRGVVNSSVYRVEEALICVGSEIDDDRRSRGDCRRHLDVQDHFAVGARWVTGRMIGGAIDGHGDHRGHWLDTQRCEVLLQIRGAVAASKLDNPDGLPATVETGRALVEALELRYGERARRARGRSQPGT